MYDYPREKLQPVSNQLINRSYTEAGFQSIHKS